MGVLKPFITPRRVVLFLFSVCMGVMAMLHFENTSMHGDSGAFSAVSSQLLHGKILYKEVWDMKPPGIFFIYAIFEFLGNGNPNIFLYFQGLLVGLVAFCMANIQIQVFGKKGWISIIIIPTLFYFFMNWGYYLNGFFIEEIGSYLIFFSALVFLQKKEGSSKYVYGGILSVLAFLCKEPFVFLILGLVVFVFASAKHKTKSLLLFFTGNAIPVIAVVLYLLFTGAWGNYIQYLQFAFGYSGVDGQLRPGWWKGIQSFFEEWQKFTPFLRMFFWVGIVSLFDNKSPSQYQKYTGIWVLLFFLSSFIPALGLVQYGHYFLPMAFFGGLVGMQGLLWLIARIFLLVSAIFEDKSWAVPMAFILLIIGIIYTCSDGLQFFISKKYPQKIAAKIERDAMLKITNSMKNIYVDMEYFGYYYYQGGFKTDIPIPCPYGGYYDGSSHPELAEKNREQFKQSFISHPPHGILTGKTFSAAISYSGLWNYTLEHYELKDSFANSQGDKTYFWQLK